MTTEFKEEQKFTRMVVVNSLGTETWKRTHI